MGNNMRELTVKLLDVIDELNTQFYDTTEGNQSFIPYEHVYWGYNEEGVKFMGVYVFDTETDHILIDSSIDEISKLLLNRSKIIMKDIYKFIENGQ